MHQAVHFNQNSVLCSCPASSTSSRCTAAVEPDCVAKINSTVWQKPELLPPPVTFQPRSINPTPQARGQWQTELNDGVQGSACAQPSTACCHPANTPPFLGTAGGKPKQSTGQTGSQNSTFLTHICPWLISPSLLEHFSDSNSEISVLSTSFPRCWEQIARFLSHYLLPAFHGVTSHPLKRTSSTRATTPPPRLIHKPTAM